MGHLDTFHTERYISNSDTTVDLPESIKILAVSALQSGENKKDLAQLKEKIFTNFNKDDINFIPEAMLTSYLEELYLNDDLQISIIDSHKSLSGKAICVHTSSKT